MHEDDGDDDCIDEDDKPQSESSQIRIRRRRICILIYCRRHQQIFSFRVLCACVCCIQSRSLVPTAVRVKLSYLFCWLVLEPRGLDCIFMMIIMLMIMNAEAESSLSDT